jgi:TP901 family phage tail tape measure protein
MTLPKAGVQLVAENFNQFLNTIDQSQRGVQNFAAAAGTSMIQVNNAVNGVKTNGAVNEIDEMGRAMERQQPYVSRFQQVLQGAFMNIGMFITNQFMNKLSQVTGWLVEAPQAAAGFADKMNRYFAVADSGAESMRTEIEGLVMQLGKELPITANEAADAAIELAKGGLTAATLQAGALRSSINFATSAGIGLAEAATINIKQLGTFTKVGATAAEQAEFMAQSMDLMTKAANTSSVDVPELAHGLLQAGGTAKAVGVEYRDFVMTMGALSPAFSSAAEAGTSFKNFLLRLQPNSDKAYDQMVDLGLITGDVGKMMQYLAERGVKPAGNDINTLTTQVTKYMSQVEGLDKKDISKAFKYNLSTNELYNANGQLKTMTEVSGILQKATAGLTNQQKSQAMATIFGNDAMGAAVQLSSLGADGMSAFSTQMNGAKGVAEMFAATMKGAELAQTNFEGTMDTLQTSIGTHFLPLMEQSYNLGNNVASMFLNMSEALRGNEESMSALSPTMQGIVKYIKDIGNAWGIMQAGFSGNNIKYALNTLPTSLASIVKWLVIAKDWWGQQTSATGTATVYYDKIIATGQQLVKFFMSLQKYVTPLSDAWSILTVELSKLAVNVMPLLNDVFGNFTANTDDAGQTITSVFAAAVEILATSLIYIVQITFGAVNGILDAYNQLRPIIVPTLRYIAAATNAAFSTIIEVVRFAFSLIRGIMTNDSNAMTNAWQSFATRMQEIWSTYWASVMTILNNIGAQVKKSFYDFLAELPKMVLRSAYEAGVYVAQTRNAIVNGFTDAWNTAKYVFENAWPMMKLALSTFPNKMSQWISETWTFVVKQFNNLWKWDNVGKNMTDGFIKGLQDNIGKVWDAVVRFAKQVLAAFNRGTQSSSPSRAFMRAAKNVTDGFVVGIDKNESAVMQAVQSLARGAVATAGTTINKTMSTVNYYNNTNQNAYNLGVNTMASSQDVISNFSLMQVMT